MKKNFIKFLIESKKKGYAAGDKNIIQEKDLSYSTRGEDGEFAFHDNWFGGEPFGGREVVFLKGKPYWMMIYYGSDNGKAEGIIEFLREALRQMPEDMPIRGPKLFENGDFRYVNNITGNLDEFVGVEIIYYKKEEVFKTNYAGGLVDQRQDQ